MDKTEKSPVAKIDLTTLETQHISLDKLLQRVHDQKIARPRILQYTITPNKVSIPKVDVTPLENQQDPPDKTLWGVNDQKSTRPILQYTRKKKALVPKVAITPLENQHNTPDKTLRRVNDLKNTGPSILQYTKKPEALVPKVAITTLENQHNTPDKTLQRVNDQKGIVSNILQYTKKTEALTPNAAVTPLENQHNTPDKTLCRVNDQISTGPSILQYTRKPNEALVPKVVVTPLENQHNPPNKILRRGDDHKSAGSSIAPYTRQTKDMLIPKVVLTPLEIQPDSLLWSVNDLKRTRPRILQYTRKNNKVSMPKLDISLKTQHCPSAEPLTRANNVKMVSQRAPDNSPAEVSSTAENHGECENEQNLQWFLDEPAETITIADDGAICDSEQMSQELPVAIPDETSSSVVHYEYIDELTGEKTSFLIPTDDSSEMAIDFIDLKRCPRQKPVEDIEMEVSEFLNIASKTKAPLIDPLEIEPEIKEEPLDEEITETIPTDDLLNFEWSELQYDPHRANPMSRREKFRQTASLKKIYPNVYEAFIAIWDNEIMNQIVQQTNKYGKQIIGTQAGWKKTNIDELYTYLALLLAMGMCIKPNIKDYYRNRGITDTPEFSKYMPLSRFLILSECLRFDNNRFGLTIAQAKAKISPIIVHLNTKFQQLYSLSQNIAIKESRELEASHIECKAHEVKIYELLEIPTGYVCRFEICPDEKLDTSKATSISGFIPAMVLKMVENLHHKGHTLFMDDYNSPALSRTLKRKGIDCVGTFKPSNQCVPKVVADLNETNMEPNQRVGYTSGDVDLIVWRSQNVVRITSTYHGIDNSFNDGQKPAAVVDYNDCMKVVKNCQNTSLMVVDEWYKKIFKRLLNISVSNALILFRASMHTTVPQSDYWQSLIAVLLNRHSTDKPENREVNEEPRRQIIMNPILAHLPVAFSNKKQGPVEERTCVMCKRHCVSYCPTCNVPLCAFSCHTKYHEANLQALAKTQAQKSTKQSNLNAPSLNTPVGGTQNL